MSNKQRSNLRPTEDEVQAALAAETKKWRIFRLQQVRAQAHEMSGERRRAVQTAEAEEVARLRHQIEQQCAHQQQHRVQQLQEELQQAMSSVGEAHRAAQEQLADAAAEAVRREEMQQRAVERGQRALREERRSRQTASLKNEEQQQNRRAVQIRERVRAHRVAQQPTPAALQRKQEQSPPPPAPPPVLVQEAGSLVTSQYRPAKDIVTRITADPEQLDARMCAERERLREAEERQLEQLRKEEAEHRALERGRRAAERERLQELQERLERDLTPQGVDAFLRAADASDFSHSDLDSHSSIDGRALLTEAGISGLASDTSRTGIPGISTDTSHAGISGMGSGISGMSSISGGISTDTSQAGISGMATYASHYSSSHSSHVDAVGTRYDEGCRSGLPDSSSGDDVTDEYSVVAEEDLLSCDTSELQRQVADLLRRQQLAQSSSSSSSPASPVIEGAAAPPLPHSGDDSPPFDAAAALRQAEQLLATVRHTRQQRQELLARAMQDSSSDGSSSWRTADSADHSDEQPTTPSIAGGNVGLGPLTRDRRQVETVNNATAGIRVPERTRVLEERTTDTADNRLAGEYLSEREREEYETAPTVPVDDLHNFVGRQGNKENVRQHRPFRSEHNRTPESEGDSLAEDTGSFDEEVRVRVMFKSQSESDQDSPAPLASIPARSGVSSQAAKTAKKSTDSLEFIREMKSYLGMDHDTSPGYLSPPPPSTAPPVQIPQQIYDNLRLLKRNRENIQKRLTNVSRLGGKHPNSQGVTSQDHAQQQSDTPSTSGEIDSDNPSKTSSSDTPVHAPPTSTLPVRAEHSSMYSNTPVRIYREDVKQDGTGRRPLRKRDKFELQKKIVLQNYVKRLLNTKQSELGLTSQSSVEGSAIELSSVRVLGALVGNETISSTSEEDHPMGGGREAAKKNNGHVDSQTEQLEFGRHVGGDINSVEGHLDESELDRVPSRLSDIQESSDELGRIVDRVDENGGSPNIGVENVCGMPQHRLEGSSKGPAASRTTQGRGDPASLHKGPGSAGVHTCGVQIPGSSEIEKHTNDRIKTVTNIRQSSSHVDGGKTFPPDHNNDTSRLDLIVAEQQERQRAVASQNLVPISTNGTRNLNFRFSPNVSSSSGHGFLNSNSSISIPSFPSTSTPTVYIPAMLPPPGSVSSTVSPIVSTDGQQPFHTHSAGLKEHQAANLRSQRTSVKGAPIAGSQQLGKEEKKLEVAKTKEIRNSRVGPQYTSDSTSEMPNSVEVSSNASERSPIAESRATDSNWSTTLSETHQHTDFSTTDGSTTSSALLSSGTETSQEDHSPGTVVQKQRDIYRRLLELNSMKQQFIQYLQQQERVHDNEVEDVTNDQSHSMLAAQSEEHQSHHSESMHGSNQGEIHHQQDTIDQIQRLQQQLQHLKSSRDLQQKRAEDSGGRGEDSEDKAGQDPIQEKDTRRDLSSSTNSFSTQNLAREVASAVDSGSNDWCTTDGSTTPQATQRGASQQQPLLPPTAPHPLPPPPVPLLSPPPVPHLSAPRHPPFSDPPPARTSPAPTEQSATTRRVTQPSSPATMTDTSASASFPSVVCEPLHSTPSQPGPQGALPQPRASRTPDASLPSPGVGPGFSTSTLLSSGHVTQLVPERTETSLFEEDSSRAQLSKLADESRLDDVGQSDVSNSETSFSNTSRQSTSANDSLRRLMEIVDLSKISDLSKALRRSEFLDSREDSSYTDDSVLDTTQGMLDTPRDDKQNSFIHDDRRSTLADNQSSVSMPESSSRSLESLRERQSPPSSREGSSTLSSNGNETKGPHGNLRYHLEHKLKRIEDRIISASSEVVTTNHSNSGAITVRGDDSEHSSRIPGTTSTHRDTGGSEHVSESVDPRSRVSEAENTVFRSSQLDAGTGAEVLSGRSNSSSSSCDFDEVLRRFGWARDMLTKMDKLEEDFPSTDSSTV